LRRLEPQVVVSAEHSTGGPLRGFVEITERADPYPGRPAATTHAVIQLSSGSTGPSKIIARDAANLVDEVKRYTMIAGVPRGGERIVSLASMVHVLGLVGGLLYGLHAGVTLTIPARMTADGILSTVGAGSQPTTLLGVPFHIELLASVLEPPKPPQLTGMTTGGELVRRPGHRRCSGSLWRAAAGQHVRDDRGRRHRDRPVGPTGLPALPALGLAVREGGELHRVRAGLAVPRRPRTRAAGPMAGCTPGTPAPSDASTGWCGCSAAGDSQVSRSAASRWT
jgi:hypothetical protein